MKLLLIFSSLLVVLPALSQDYTLKNEVAKSAKGKEGWTPKLKLSTNYSINSSDNVIGQTDGDSVTLGVKIESGATYIKRTNEWRNTLDFSGASTKTPTIPKYVKSSDTLKYETIYLYGLKSMPSIGPYVSASAETAAFKGEDVQATQKTYTLPDGTTRDESSLKLTDAFAPMTTKEAVGFFYKAINRPMTKLELRLGLGALQVSADDQLIVTASDDTSVTVGELESYSQSGLEYGLVFSGKWNEKSDYSITADFLTPFGTDIDTGDECHDCEDIELTNIDIKAKASTKVSDWMSVSYEYKALKQPQLLDEFQITHGFVLNMAYDVFAE